MYEHHGVCACESRHMCVCPSLCVIVCACVRVRVSIAMRVCSCVCVFACVYGARLRLCVRDAIDVGVAVWFCASVCVNAGVSVNTTFYYGVVGAHMFIGNTLEMRMH